VAERWAALPEAREARAVGLYAGLPDELPTRPLFEAVRDARKTALLPRCLDDDRLAFVAVERWGDLVPGRHGVPEPEGEPETLGPEDVVAVPGVAFDAAGRRLGRGRAYYDRTFPPGAAGGPWLVGVGYAFQVVDRVPAAPHDRRVEAVLTERETLRMEGGEGA
jgi:5-formyltetrahydrofolate cyclo-ligase